MISNSCLFFQEPLQSGFHPHQFTETARISVQWASHCSIQRRFSVLFLLDIAATIGGYYFLLNISTWLPRQHSHLIFLSPLRPLLLSQLCFSSSFLLISIGVFQGSGFRSFHVFIYILLSRWSQLVSLFLKHGFLMHSLKSTPSTFFPSS